MPPSPWTPNAKHSYNPKQGFPNLGRVGDQPAPGPSDEYRTRQDDEIEALRSIFMEDFQELGAGPTAWNMSGDHAFRLHLTAYSDSDVSVNLTVTMTSTYPKTAPLLSLSDTDFLSQACRQRLDAVIATLPRTLAGNEMIYDIASPIRDVLEEAVQAQIRGEELPSLEEERAIKEAEAARVEEARKEKSEREQQEASREEERVLEQMMMEEVERQRKKLFANVQDDGQASDDESLVDVTRADISDRTRFDHRTELRDDNGALVLFRAVSGMTKLRQGPATEVWTARPSVHGRSVKSALIVVKQATFARSALKERNLKNDVFELEKELEKLHKLRTHPHPNVLEVLNFKIEKQPGSSGDGSVSWAVTVLTEYANKGSLEDLLDMAGPLAVEKLRAWTIQLLEALEYYHCNGVIHGDMHIANILFVRTTAGSTVLKLADGGYQKRLHDLTSNVRGSDRDHPDRRATWTPPELADPTQSCQSRKLDVWDFGIVFVQMALGSAIVQQYLSSVALLESVALSFSLEDFVRRMFKQDPRKRPAAFDLMKCEFLRSNDPVIAQPSSAYESGLLSSTSSIALTSGRSRRDSIAHGAGLMRYANEFQELGRLGKGGFGEVFKARNKLDGQLYAVKKITQNSPAALSDVLSETILLSRLNHPNVVRYFNTWLEEDVSTLSETDEDAVSFESSVSRITGQTLDFGQSTGGLDILSSAGAPQIEFTYDSDDESSSSEAEEDAVDDKQDSLEKALAGDAEDANPLQRVVSNSRSPRQMRTILYIQMEYCEKHTLRDLIKQGLSGSVDRCWQLFRQIVEGLNHIHGHGIVHRDLKPENVFADITGSARIGDLGLATSGRYYLVDSASSAGGDVQSNMTRSIGTALYVAPEMRSGVNSHYNEKVDMYSLGIIFFEMCHSLKTGMERDQVLRALRSKDHVLPADFSKPEKAVQGEIIEMLISHKPSERPGTTELLQSGKIPLQIQDETIRQALQGLWNADSPHYNKMMSALFSQPTKPAKDLAWDLNSTTPCGSNELLLQQTVKERLIQVFRHHGAVEAARPRLFPRSKFYSTNVAQLLDSSGTLLQLPFDLTLPYARLLAKRPPSAQKTFSFDDVYRDLYTGGQPSSHGEVDFDIVSRDARDLALKEAETMAVINEIVDAFPSLKSTEMCFHISHSDLLDMIMDFCRIEETQRATVKEVVSKLNIGQWTWQKIRHELRSPSLGIPSTSLDDLARFDFRDMPDKAFKSILDIFGGSGNADRCSSVFAHLSAVYKYLTMFNVQRKIYVSPLSSFNAKFYGGGLMFQCLFDGKKKDVFAAGGRYDALIEEHRPRVHSQSGLCRAVGFNLGWDKLWTSMSRYQKMTAKTFLKKPHDAPRGQWSLRRCDVLVASFDPQGLRSAGINILRQLWANDISAELAVDAHSTDELLAHYKDDKHSWIVIIKQDSGMHGEKILKVKSMVRKEDTEIRSSELMSWLRMELRERDQREGTNDRIKLLRAINNGHHNESGQLGGGGGGGGGGGEGSQDVRVLVSAPKGKKHYRRNVVEAAQARTQELIHSFAEGPIAAINVRDDVLDAIRNTAVGDTDGWRQIIKTAPLAERKYLTQVYELITDMARDKKRLTRDAFIYNSRTGGCVYYDLERGDGSG